MKRSATPLYDIQESRRIRLEQDLAFSESLQVDRAKVIEAELQEQIENLRELVKARMHPNVPEGLKFSIRLPNSSNKRVEICLATESSSMALYEAVFAMSTITTPFQVFELHPRKLIPTNCLLSECNLSTPIVVVAELSEDAPNIFDLFPHEIYESSLLTRVKDKRINFLSRMSGVHRGLCHEISRNGAFQNLTDLYRKHPQTMTEYPFSVRFEGELAVDMGGVSRDLFSAFWECAYTQAFDGSSTLIPQAHPHIDMSMYPILGTILSHGFLVTGILPVRLSFPTIAATVFGPTVEIPTNIYITSLIDYISPYEADVLQAAFSVKSDTFPRQLCDDLICFLSRLGCRQIPTHDNLKRLVVEVAKHEFITRPLMALYALQSGVPVPHLPFWKNLSVDDLYSIYKELIALPASVIRNIDAPADMNSAQETVFGYLTQMIGNMKQKELSNFLRFVTGSSVLMEGPIHVTFNSLSGVARRPVAHTCGCRLELPTSYLTYIEFETEFKAILNHTYAWIMDSIRTVLLNLTQAIYYYIYYYYCNHHISANLL